MEEKIFDWSMAWNLSELVKFHNHTGRLFQLAKDDTEDFDELERRLWKDYYEKHFPDKLRISVFLMMFGHIEEYLYLIHQRRKVNIDYKSGLNRYKPLLRHAFGSELGSCKAWLYLQDASQVRHALLHAAGRVSLMRNPDELKRIARQRRESFRIKSDRIRVEAEGLRHLADQTSDLLVDLNRRLRTRLD